INIIGVEATAVSSLSAFTLATSSGADAVTLDSLAANQSRFSGTSNGVAFAPVTYSSVANVTIKEDGGTDSLTINATTGDDTIAMTSNSVTVNGNTVNFSGVDNLFVNALEGNDTVTMTSIDPNVTTTVSASTDAAAAADTDTFAATLTADFASNLTLQHFDSVTFHVDKDASNNPHDFTGKLTVTGSGTINDLGVSGSITQSGCVSTETITSMTVTGSVSGCVIAKGSGSIGSITVGGSIMPTGSVTTETITTMT